MNIYCIHIDQILEKTSFQEMIQYVSAEKQDRIQRFRKPIDATRSLYGDLMIRFILCKYHGFSNNEISYDYQEFGKPYLPLNPDFHFNISHSGDWVIGVVSKDLVGIDIEKITDVKTDFSSLAFTDEENQKLMRLHESERNAHFFELWTLKESYVKATGKGLSEGLNTLKISMDNGIIGIEKNENPVQAYFEMLECIEGYKIALCSLTKNRDRTTQVFSITEFGEEVKKILKSYYPIY